MNHFKSHYLLLMFGLLLNISAEKLYAQAATVPAQNSADLEWLSSNLKRQKTFDGMISVELKDVNQFETLLLSTLAEIEKPQDEISIEHLRERWDTIDWQLLESPSGKFFVLREDMKHRHGRGVYAFRTDAQSRIVIQAPHRFNDLMTGSIAIKLLRERSVSAIALNTIHRKEIDLSHTRLHFINAFTAASIKVRQDVAILQIHGFTQEGKTGAAKSTSVIVSDSTKFPGRSARQSALELKTAFGADHTRLFPVDIRQLGGTTNRQAQIAHSLGCPDFLHIEFNRDFRAQLNNNPSVRAAFIASMNRGLSK